MDTLKELLAPKAFNKISFVAVLICFVYMSPLFIVIDKAKTCESLFKELQDHHYYIIFCYKNRTNCEICYSNVYGKARETVQICFCCSLVTIVTNFLM